MPDDVLQSPDREQRLDEAVTAFLEEQESGHRPQREEWLVRYPEVAAELVQFFADQDEVDRLTGPLRSALHATPTPDDTPHLRPLDGTLFPLAPSALATPPLRHSATPPEGYELLQVLGQGGMGLVYKARQKSAGRLVALKLIRAERLTSDSDVQRFRNEAEAAAQLDHPHIVPVYEVSARPGHFFFSMKLIEGGGLDEQLERFRDDLPGAARLVAQVARAVHHAHQRGILHRDLKPSNILLDSEGKPHVSDFGLAKRIEADGSLTQTGAIVGTPQYMAPEQTSGRKGVVTTATDLYGLGTVLYALLTGRAPFRGETVLETLEQVRDLEPEPPGESNAQIDRELEAVCLKCLNKEPARRYASAEALAEDLDRWLRGEPVTARPAGWAERLGRWMLRHRLAVGAVVCVLLSLTALGAGIGWIVGDRAARRAEARESFDQAVLQSITSMQQEKWLEAKAAAQRAADLLAGTGDDLVRQQRLQQLERDSNMAETLEFIRLQKAAVNDGHFDDASAAPAYAAAFDDYNLPVLDLEPEEAAPRIVASAIGKQLLVALVDWSNVHPDSVEKKKLRMLLRLADRNAWQQQVWDAVDDRDGAKLVRLAQSAEALDQPPGRLESLYSMLGGFDKPAAIKFLRQAQQRHPDDFWINLHLAYYLTEMEPTQREEAIGFYRAALALRPYSPGVHMNLGIALHHKGQREEAIAELREAIRLKQDFALAHSNLGNALREKGQLDEAIAEFREAIRLKKDYAAPHYNLGNALREKGHLDEAIAEYREVLRINMDHADTHVNLGIALAGKGLLDEAIVEFRQAVRLKKDHANAYCNLGNALRAKGQLDEAIAELQESVRLKKDYAVAHNNLGIALRDKGQFDEAIAEYREALRIKTDYTLARNNLLQAEQMARINARLVRVLEGKEAPKDPVEHLDFARLCVMPHQKRYASSARFFREAFAEESKLADDLDAGHRYNAACAAALAGCGQGNDADKLDTKEQSRLREQALNWLRADLKAYGQLMEKSAGKAGSIIAQRMQHWLQDTDLAGVRNAESMARLPEAECPKWQKFWEEVKTLRQRAAERPKTIGSARP